MNSLIHNQAIARASPSGGILLEHPFADQILDVPASHVLGTIGNLCLFGGGELADKAILQF
jgi:hypothetical protein